MNQFEICNQYQISLTLFKAILHHGILDDISYDIKGDDYGEMAIQRVKECLCLHSLGLELNVIKQYLLLEASKEDTRQARLEILQRQRERNLHNVHRTKSMMDCIDTVIEELSSKKNT